MTEEEQVIPNRIPSATKFKSGMLEDFMAKKEEAQENASEEEQEIQAKRRVGKLLKAEGWREIVLPYIKQQIKSHYADARAEASSENSHKMRVAIARADELEQLLEHILSLSDT